MKRALLILSLGLVVLVVGLGLGIRLIQRSPMALGIAHSFCPILVPTTVQVENLDSGNTDLIRESLALMRERAAPKGVKRAIELLKSPDDYVWLNAALYLGACKQAEATPYLIKGLRHTAWRSDPETVKCLEELTGLKYGTDFEKWRDWWVTSNPDTTMDWDSKLGFNPRLPSTTPSGGSAMPVP